MANPLSNPCPVLVSKIICDKCERNIRKGGVFYAVKTSIYTRKVFSWYAILAQKVLLKSLKTR